MDKLNRHAYCLLPLTEYQVTFSSWIEKGDYFFRNKLYCLIAQFQWNQELQALLIYHY